MRTGYKHKHPLEEGLEHINPIKAMLVKILGPADGRGNPLVGTQYDPIVRQKIDTERRHERWARQDERRHARAERRHSLAEGRSRRLRSSPHGTANSRSTRIGLPVPVVSTDE